MKEQIEIIVGTKIEPEEAAKMDRTKMGVMIAGAPIEQDVTGQYAYYGYTRCPWCGHVGQSPLDTERWIWYTCGLCGRSFTAHG